MENNAKIGRDLILNISINCVFHSIELIWPLYLIFTTYLLVFYKPSYYFSLIELAVNSIFQLIFMIIYPYLYWGKMDPWVF